MPLIVLCGVPCVGKSTFSIELSEKLKDKGYDVTIISEESLSILKSDGYKDNINEKNTRSSIKSATARIVSNDCVVIVDSLNYIKGYRYELYCLARERRTKNCLVWCTLDDSEANKRHQQRIDHNNDTYNRESFIELRRRFEVPNDKNRWEAPLFEVNMSTNTVYDTITNIDDRNDNSIATTVSNPASIFSKIDSLEKKDKSNTAEISTNSTNSTTISLDPNKKSSFTRFKKFNKLEKHAGTKVTATATTNTTSTTDYNTNDTNDNTSFDLQSLGHSRLQLSQSMNKKVDEGDIDTVVSAFISMSTSSGTNTVKNSDGKVWFSGNKVTRDEVRGKSPKDTIDSILDYLDDTQSSGVAGTIRNLQSTAKLHHASASTLTELDATSQDIVNALADHQERSQAGTPLVLKQYENVSICLGRHIPLTVLQRHRRQFIKVNSLYPPKDTSHIAAAFIDYLKNQIA